MRYSAVNDGSLFHATAHRLYAAVDLRDHATGDDALALEERHFADVDKRNEGRRIVLVPEQSGDVGHQDQIFRPELCSDPCRRRIRIDVVSLSEIVSRHRSNYRNIAVVQRIQDGLLVDLYDIAHKAQIFAVGTQLALCGQHMPVDAAHTVPCPVSVSAG